MSSLLLTCATWQGSLFNLPITMATRANQSVLWQKASVLLAVYLTTDITALFPHGTCESLVTDHDCFFILSIAQYTVFFYE